MEVVSGNKEQLDTAKLEGEGQDLAKLLRIPETIVFPYELNIHLKDKLQIALEENFCLKKQLADQENLVANARHRREISPSDKLNESRANHTMMANPQLATKVVELSKKIRDMTADQESTKTKLRQVLAENERLQNELRECRQCDNCQSATEGNAHKSSASEEEIISTSQQMANLTNKMMEYRRQTQQLRLELRTALKALSLEVGDGTTPQTVLKVVNQASWRGRQQQILTLQQKLTELQHKISASQLSQASSFSHLGGGEGCNRSSHVPSELDRTEMSVLDTPDEARSLIARSSNISGISFPASMSQRKCHSIQTHEQNKHEQLEKLNQELATVWQDLKDTTMSYKASKARVQTLEEQGKHYRAHIEALEGRLANMQAELKDKASLLSRTHHEMEVLSDRLRASRDAANEEIRNLSQQLFKERAQNTDLRKEVESKEHDIRKLGVQLQTLQTQLSHYSSISPEERSAVEQLHMLRSQLETTKQALLASADESKRLLSLMEESVMRVDEERQKHCETQRHMLKAFAVIDFAEQCIVQCLDAGQIHDKAVLAAVEDLRSMRRELKTGDLFHLEPTNVSDVRKLKARIKILNSEIHVLQNTIRNGAAERKKDLQNFATMIEKVREEFLTAATYSTKLCSESLMSVKSLEVLAPVAEKTDMNPVVSNS